MIASWACEKEEPFGECLSDLTTLTSNQILDIDIAVSVVYGPFKKNIFH